MCTSFYLGALKAASKGLPNNLLRDLNAIHANTTIGIEETRDFVRNTCEEWGLALMERKPHAPPQPRAISCPR